VKIVQNLVATSICLWSTTALFKSVAYGRGAQDPASGGQFIKAEKLEEIAAK
jgi:hypothetical protein